MTSPESSESPQPVEFLRELPQEPKYFPWSIFGTAHRKSNTDSEITRPIVLMFSDDVFTRLF